MGNAQGFIDQFYLNQLTQKVSQKKKMQWEVLLVDAQQSIERTWAKHNGIPK